MIEQMKADLENAISKAEESRLLAVKWQGIAEFLQAKINLEEGKDKPNTEKEIKKQGKSKK